ncbi:hypothetical protein DCC85_01630 [Paenibacillus sp. CAA11]|uniref:RDD family protein n=1 Tax=Paenibacillus sp. CAA11 TaxID=1532905 RepID=UPI000D37987D|nr:RDD family protein [Paenibacillus sp. CAA11]AWB43057.1 hypothetical protein DCC85_01630 [Paenibacillus sp. CAA11]
MNQGRGFPAYDRLYPVEPMRRACYGYGFSIVVRRWAAAVIDYIVLAALVAGLVTINLWTGIPEWPGFITFMVTFTMLLVFAYYWLLEGFTGFTIGKFLLRIRVLQGDGRVPGLLKSLLRTLLRLIELNPFLLGGLPALICTAATQSKQRLGDMAAHTYVVKLESLPAEQRGSTRVLVSAFSVAGILVLVMAALGIREIIHRETATQPVMSKDMPIQLSVQKDWKVFEEMSGKKLFSLTNEKEDSDVMVASEPLESLDGDVQLQDYFRIMRETMLGEAANDDSSIIEAPRMLEIDGHEAILFKYKSSLGEDKMNYVWSGVLKTDKYIYQLNAWTPESSSEKVQEEVEKVLLSFREVDPEGDSI